MGDEALEPRGAPRSFTGLSRLILALALIIAALVAVWVDGRDPAVRSPASGNSAIHVSEQDHGLRPTGGEPSAPRVRGIPVDPAGEPMPALLAGGIVLDDLFDNAVVAWIEPDRGPGVFSAPDTGEFRLQAGSLPWSTLRASAPGYEPAELRRAEVTDSEHVEIRLRATRRACVVVETQDGSPVPGVAVNWRSAVDRPELEAVTRWIDGSAHKSGRSRDTRTDSQGVSCTPLSVPGLAVIQDPRSKATHTVRVAPGQELLVVLPDDSLMLRFVDATSLEPLSGLELEAWCPRESAALSVTLRSDGDGRVVIAVPSYPVQIRRPGAGLWQSELIPLSAGAWRCGTGGDLETMIRIDAAPSLGPIEIGVRPCGARLLLIDEATGEPVEAPVRIARRKHSGCGGSDVVTFCTLLSPRSAFGLPDEVYRSKAGLLELPCLLDSEQDRADGVHARGSAVVIAAGYEPTDFEIPDGPRAGAPPLVVPLRPAQARRLRVVREDGIPFRQPVAIHSPLQDILCWTSFGTSTGIHGPFDWFGGDLLVKLGEGTEWGVRLKAGEIDAADTLVLTVPRATGSILVRGVSNPTVASGLIAKLGVGLQGTEYRPTSAGPGECRFDSVPEGSYLVGPREWVLGGELQSMRFDPNDEGTPTRMRVDVRAGSTTVVDWVDAWACGRAIEGRVQVRSIGRVEPFLVPLYTPAVPGSEDGPDARLRMVFGRRSPRISLDRHGNYRLGPGDPLPRLIAICVANDTPWGGVSGLHVLDTILPGESIEISTGSVELRWVGQAPPGTEQVSYDVPAETLRHPLHTFHTRCQRSWVPGTTLRIDGIPLRITELHWRRGSIPVALREGELVRVAVDPTQLQPVTR